MNPASTRIPTLVTKRLVMRPPSVGDLPDLVALFGDSEVTHFVLHGKTMPPRQVAHMLEGILTEARHGSLHPAWIPGVPGWLTIVRPDTQEFVGLGTLRMLAPDLVAAIGGCPELAIELGYILVRELWGQGFATEIAQGLLDYGIKLAGPEHVIAVADVGNAASHRVLAKVGFIQRKEFEYRDMRMNYWTLRSDSD
ncbi:MAG TPA: GNAT family N-acetyltransferase [Fimbriimonadaceae bacterium]|nr:GNAT family N-acetyltransferase [Fimbriimonadaceae bacterium]